MSINCLPNDKILDKLKLKAFAVDKLKVLQIAKFVLDKIENMLGKEENAMVSTGFFFRVIKSRDCAVNSLVKYLLF